MAVDYPAQEPPAECVTLLVRHLPDAISHEMLCRLFSHYGAVLVRPCAGGKLRNCAFVDFKDATLALQAQAQLNRLRFLGKVLSVERANRVAPEDKGQGNETKDSVGLPAISTNDASSTGHTVRATSGMSLSAEPIAPKLGVDYPFPPHLEYAYPPPDGNILTNIVNALIAVPRFYTQVLHLMNKMNLPAPFRMALPTPPLPPPVVAAPPPPPTSPPPSPPLVPVSHQEDLLTDESELHSSDGDTDDKSDSGGRHIKRAKRESIVGPAIDKDVAHEAVGLKHAALIPKEIPIIKKKNPVLQIKIIPKSVPSDPKEDDAGKELAEKPCEGSLDKRYAMPQDIENSRLPPEEILSLPMFKNYTAGAPANVLYIKNLAKDVVADDFYFMFGSLFGSVESARHGLDIKLMREGRMRGQAFVTFPSVELACSALNLINGYVFKGKPIIIQFGRNQAAARKA